MDRAIERSAERRPAAIVRAAVLVAVLAACGCRAPGGLGTPTLVAPGVELYALTDSALVNGEGPIAIHLLKLDPAKVRIASALSNDEVMDVAAPVDAIAARHHALAAINGGYFNRANGDPMGLLKVAGEIVSDSTLVRGAVIIYSPPSGRTTLAFDRLSAKLTLRFRVRARDWRVPVDGVDTTRERGRLMLYTHSYHADTDTAPTGTEWVLDGSPLRVVAVNKGVGRTPIPRLGAVLSFGGLTPPDGLAALEPDTPVTFETNWKSVFGTPPADLDRADHIVSGAGLLRRQGVVLNDWRVEGLNPDTFPAARHPRTFIGDDGRGFVWLGVVDGREPGYSIGMTFDELERLCDRLALRNALNLDGGGSTTMAVHDEIVNRPSDPQGPRPVSDAILVTPR